MIDPSFNGPPKLRFTSWSWDDALLGFHVPQGARMMDSHASVTSISGEEFSLFGVPHQVGVMDCEPSPRSGGDPLQCCGPPFSCGVMDSHASLLLLELP